MFSKHVACVVPVRVTAASYGGADEDDAGKEIVAGTPMVYSKDAAENSDDMYLHAYAGGRPVDVPGEFKFCGVVIESAPPRPSEEDEYEVISLQAGGVVPMRLELPENTGAVNYGDPVYLAQHGGRNVATLSDEPPEEGYAPEVIGRIHHCNDTNASNKPITVTAEVRLGFTDLSAREAASASKGADIESVVDAAATDVPLQFSASPLNKDIEKLPRLAQDQDVSSVDSGSVDITNPDEATLRQLVDKAMDDYLKKHPNWDKNIFKKLTSMREEDLRSLYRLITDFPGLCTAMIALGKIKEKIEALPEGQKTLPLDTPRVYYLAETKADRAAKKIEKGELSDALYYEYTSDINSAVQTLQDYFRRLEDADPGDATAEPGQPKAAMGVDTVSPLTPEPSPAKRGRSKRKRRGASVDPMMEDE